MPFLSSLAWAAVFGIVFYPLYQYILRYVRSPSVAAAASVIVVVVAILAPLSYLSYLLVLEIENISPRALTIEGLTEMYSHSFLQPFIQKVLSLFDLSEEQALGYVANAAGTVSRQLLSRLSAGLGNVASAVVSFAIMVFVLFFFFRDGRKYVGNIQELLPLSEKNKEYVSGQVKDVVVSTIYGGVAVALAQGIVSSLGYMLVGIHSPLLWGLTTAIASFIPVVVSSLVWGPLCIYLLDRKSTRLNSSH
jgi:predicted PurR-regulated permease PerM